MIELKKFPRVNLGNVVMRQLYQGDAAAYMEYMNHPEVRKFVTSNNVPKDIAASTREVQYWGGLFARQVSVCWGIECNLTKKLIGTIGFNYWSKHNRRVEVNYDLDHAYWGRGIMSAVFAKVIEYAEKEMQIIRIQASVSKENVRSIALLEKFNFKQEGELKKYEILESGPTDYYLYARV